MNQNNLEQILDMVRLGQMTIEEANVEMVRSERVRIVSKMPKKVRNHLNNAVKNGKLSHLKKDGHKPEAYFHPDFLYMANAKRNEIAENTIQALRAVFTM